MTRIKICGLTHREDVSLCVAAGVQALGFVVEYPLDVPWNLDRCAAGELMRSVPPLIARVLVVGGDPGTVVELSRLLKPQAIQLHGNEPIETTAKIVSALHEQGVHAIKPLRFSVETGQCAFACNDPFEAARLIEAAEVDMLLLDSVSESRPAGTGRSIDWRLARKLRESVRLPVVLAGGLHPGNVGEAVAAVSPYGVDVLSGVESPVGRKDPAKIQAFVKAVSLAMTGTPECG